VKKAIFYIPFLSMIVGCAHQNGASNIEFIDPDKLLKIPMFHQVAVASGTSTIHIAGQTAMDEQMNIVGEGDFKAQAAKVWGNVATALDAAGASMDSIVSSHVFVVDLKPELIPQIMEVMGNNAVPPHAYSIIGVEALARPELLIEISVVAVK
jgi:2-iminobutanoate/2-iminopropanoate deaminase